jgi:oligopeptide/dipeptide ABC transporter ATP-binding protein
MSTALLELRNVTKVFSRGIRRTAKTTTIALRDVSFRVQAEPATTLAIAGESGSGKTTMARLLLGFIRPTSGQVLYRGVDLAQMNRTERSQFRREVQPIFQDPFEVYNPFYKVDHALTTALRNFRLANNERDLRRVMVEALEVVGLRPEETLGRYPHELSGGQRQRIMVARAIMLRPRVIMADEPVSMVDASLRATILEYLRKTNAIQGVTVLYITHDLNTAFQVCDNILILYQGSVVEAGSVEKVIRDPQHPYTKLLISSIPQVDRSAKWGADEPHLRETTPGATSDACAFAPRCPAAMARCWTAAPPLFQMNEAQAASCFLYEGHSPLPADRIGEVLDGRGAPIT